MYMKKIFILTAFVFSLCILTAEEERDPSRVPLIPVFDESDDNYLNLTFGLDLGIKQKSFWTGENVRMDFSGGPFTLVADLYMSNDQKYAPARAMLPSGNFLGNYFLMNEGGLSFTLKNFYLEGGRFKLYDIVDSPYSLFINSQGNSSNTLSIKYDSPRFIYQSRWIELNSRSGTSSPAWNEYHRREEQGDLTSPSDGSLPGTLGFPDRGANYKIYAFKSNDWRFGFLDAAVYTGRSFDFEYFLNPIPQYFIQYVKVTPGRPWATDWDEANLIGMFWDINKKDQWNAYAQILIDDFSLGFLKFIYDGFEDNPWKAAWALGGGIHTPYGRFGFHHGGSLKYNFEPITNKYGGNIEKSSYGYTYYPETRYYDEDDLNNPISILIEDNMLGYKYGENNIAFQVDYRNTFYNFLVNSELEFVLRGSNSPANPWQDYAESEPGTRIFNDETLEKSVELRINVSRVFGPWSLYAAAAVGGRFNKLVLQRPDYNGDSVTDQIYIWKASDKHEVIFRFSIGAKFTLGVL
jgi:hypothetical protein